MFVPARSPATNASVPARDFSAWLQRTVSPDDEVHLVLDAAGAPALLPRPRTPPPPPPSLLPSHSPFSPPLLCTHVPTPCA